MKLGTHTVENFGTPFVIAEIGANHNGDLEIAKQLVDAAAATGCQCVKFQSWTKNSVFSRQVYEDNYFMRDDYRDRDDYTLEQIVEAFVTTSDQLKILKDHCDKKGVVFSCTPFSKRETDFLVDELDIDFIKVASMDCNNYPFLEYIGSKGKPVVLSTGMSSMAEVTRAVETLSKAGCTELAILHCVAQYPPDLNNLHLNNIEMLRELYPDHVVGYSDHTLGTDLTLASMAMGSAIIEKHFTLDKDMFGWDHKVSATPEELQAIVDFAKIIKQARGSHNRAVSAADEETRKSFRRSVVTTRDMKAGEVFTRDDLDFKRPGTGFPPEAMDMIIGRTAKRDIEFDRLIQPEDI